MVLIIAYKNNVTSSKNRQITLSLDKHGSLGFNYCIVKTWKSGASVAEWLRSLPDYHLSVTFAGSSPLRVGFYQVKSFS